MCLTIVAVATVGFVVGIFVLLALLTRIVACDRGQRRFVIFDFSSQRDFLFSQRLAVFNRQIKTIFRQLPLSLKRSGFLLQAFDLCFLRRLASCLQHFIGEFQLILESSKFLLSDRILAIRIFDLLFETQQLRLIVLQRLLDFS